jgi:hypothetical protein
MLAGPTKNHLLDSHGDKASPERTRNDARSTSSGPYATVMNRFDERGKRDWLRRIRAPMRMIHGLYESLQREMEDDETRQGKELLGLGLCSEMEGLGLRSILVLVIVWIWICCLVKLTRCEINVVVAVCGSLAAPRMYRTGSSVKKARLLSQFYMISSSPDRLARYFRVSCSDRADSYLVRSALLQCKMIHFHGAVRLSMVGWSSTIHGLKSQQCGQ